MRVMAKKDAARQLAFRVPGSMAGRVEKVAARLGLDLSNFLRMLLVENLAIYERRADKIEEGAQEG